MSNHFRGFTAIAAMFAVALVLVPTAASGTYGDPAGDSGSAGDVTGVSVIGDKQGGQLVFRITGTNLATSELNMVFLSIDSDSNPLTGDLTDHGTDYWFGVDNDSYGFFRWTGSGWTWGAPTTVRVTGGGNQVMISVNRSELGNTAAFNFIASTFALSGQAATGSDDAPNDGMFNYSFDVNGPRIDSVDVQTKPSAGPKAGKKFTVTPTGLHLPADGRTNTALPTPETYACTAKLGNRTLVGTGTGSCTYSIPKKKTRGKRLIVHLTVNYEGTSQVVPLSFKVA